jgi:lipoprotein-anchoring transpeptidase ErfK/SrfK
MKTSYFLIIALALFCVAAEEAVVPVVESVSESASVLEPETPAVIQTPKPINVASKIKKAKNLEDKKEFQKAREAYEEILQIPDLTAKQKQKARKAFEEFNMRQLFSKEKTESSEIYVVVAGDNLTKIAKKYKTNIDLIKKINQLKNDTIFPGMKLKVISGSFRVSVDKSENILTLYLNEKPLKNYPVSTGVDNSTPVGEFKIINKVEDPAWFKDKKTIPPGSPENELGSRWLGFDKPGYGIHGTVDPKSIGSQMSSGCVRMHNKDVEEIYVLVPHGTLVTVTD